ncbi:equilibrative nucleoside transporter 2-like isoform X2 [Myxocyprinus asiaticus]|uniref:equilibrative nucleoside transporter 2-like isoform X2 n=1 Tax=Myxocyprinus asiaticus TaxID=70543 RepID=UPI0022235EFE|nr:equilibrative nucleoside transporter 2-like isoform X2 [Myxocyprinus asiaticus]
MKTAAFRTSRNMSTKEDATADRGFLVGIIFFILGLGTLLPWNFFMTASMYFNNKLNASEWKNGTLTVRKEYYFNNWMTLLSQLPLLLFTLLNSILYQRISEKMRIAGSLLFILLLFILTAVLVKVPMEEDRFFSVTMATIWFINSFVAVLQGSLFGLVGLLPQKYSAVFMSGQGLAGTFAAFAMISALASEADSETAALGYFITPCVVTLFTIMCYMLLPKLEFARFYLDKCKSKSYELETFSQLLPTERYFIPVCCFLIFNFMDWIGRTVTSLVQWPPKDSRLFPVLVVSRLIFVPLLMMCNVQERHLLPVLFSNDLSFAAIMVFFSVSSGYCACLSMTYAPQLVESKDGETAGALMTFFLALGLSLGAGFSFPLRFMV